jgi:hypothetical protein
MSTNQNVFASQPFYRPTGISSVATRMQRTLWLTDWIFSFDAEERIPCLETADLGPNIMGSPENFAGDFAVGPDFESQYNDYPIVNEVQPTFRFREYWKSKTFGNNQTPYINPTPDLKVEKKYTTPRRYTDQLLYSFYCVVASPSQTAEKNYIIMPYWEPYEHRRTLLVDNALNIWSVDDLFNYDEKSVSSVPSKLMGLQNSSYTSMRGWNFTPCHDFFSYSGGNFRTDFWSSGQVIPGADTGDTTGLYSVSDLSYRGWWSVYTETRQISGPNSTNYRGNLFAVVDE